MGLECSLVCPSCSATLILPEEEEFDPEKRYEGFFITFIGASDVDDEF